jgi:hypothetical protein
MVPSKHCWARASSAGSAPRPVGGIVAGGSPDPGGGGALGLLGGGALGEDGRGLLDDEPDELDEEELDDAELDEEPDDGLDDAVELLRVGSATVVGSSSRSRKNSSAPIPAITSTPTTVRTTARFLLRFCAG